MLFKRKGEQEQPGAASNGLLVDLTRRVGVIEADVSSLMKRVKQFDYDLQDAVDGFYRRRQSDRMREVKEEEAVKSKPRQRLTTGELIRMALKKSESSTDDTG